MVTSKSMQAQLATSHNKKNKCILVLMIAVLSLCAFLPAAYAADVQFGVTTAGNQNYPTSTFGIVSDTSTGNAGSANNLVATKYTLSVAGTVTKIGGYSAANGHWKLGIYSDNAGTPDTLLAANNNNNVVVANSDNSFSIGPVYLPAGTYWIAIISDVGSSRPYKAGTPSQTYGWTNYMYSNPLPSTFSTYSTNNNNAYFAYCTYVQVEGYAKATKVTLAEDNAQLNSVSFYSHSTGNYRVAIYSDNSGPNTLKWQSGDSAATIGWNTITITTGSPASLTLPSGIYWIVYQWNSANLGPSYTASSSGAGNYATMSTYGSFPASWTGGTASAEQWSVYATYTSTTPSVLPENPVGAILAVVLCFGALAVFVKTRKP